MNLKYCGPCIVIHTEYAYIYQYFFSTHPILQTLQIVSPTILACFITDNDDASFMDMLKRNIDILKKKFLINVREYRGFTNNNLIIILDDAMKRFQTMSLNMSYFMK